MDIETRVTNLENMLASVVASINRDKLYADADISGVRKATAEVSEAVPYTETKRAYLDDTETTFDIAKKGTVLATVTTDEGEEIANSIEIINDKIIVHYDALDVLATVTITII